MTVRPGAGKGHLAGLFHKGPEETGGRPEAVEGTQVCRTQHLTVETERKGSIWEAFGSKSWLGLRKGRDEWEFISDCAV